MTDELQIGLDRSRGDGIIVAWSGVGVSVVADGRTPLSVFDPATGRIVEVNEAWLATYGYTREEAHRMRVQDVSAEPSATSAAVLRALQSGGARIDVRWHRTKTGRVFPVELTSGLLTVGDRPLLYALMHDIEPRMRAEEELRRSEARFRGLIESNPVGMLVHDGTHVRFVNRALRELLRHGADEPPTLVLTALVHPDDPWPFGAIGDAAREVASSTVEARLLVKNGPAVHCEISESSIEYDGSAMRLAVVRDVGDRKRMEQQLLIADRMSSLGRLAASVGHEINNPLAYVMMSSELLMRDVERATDLAPGLRDRLIARIATLAKGASRVRDIVRDLKQLSVAEETAATLVDLHRVLDACADMASHEIRHRASLVRDYGDPVRVRAHEARLGQVFLNLLVNAAEALPEGRVTENEVRVSTRRTAAGEVEVEIADTGPGIPSELRDRLFEPFFTTKPGTGTGLGLSISHSIVRSLGGRIEVVPSEGRGARIRVTLACTDDAENAPRRESAPASAPLAEPARPRVLVADDEEALAATLGEMLEDYDVTVVHGGREAIARLRETPFAAVLLDLRMPDVTGVDVVRWLEDHDPTSLARVVLMTGGAPHDRPTGPSVHEVLHKPFDLAALRRAVDRVVTAHALGP